MEPSLESVRAGQAFAEAEVDTCAEGVSGDAISKAELENAEILFRQKNEELRSTLIAEEIARFELEQAQAAARTRPQRTSRRTRDHVVHVADARRSERRRQVLHRRQRRLELYDLFADHRPRAARAAREPAVVNAGTPLLELGDPLDLEAEIDVLSRDAVKIRPGARVLFGALGRR